MTSEAIKKSEPKHARLVLVDGSGYIFRAYHALPPLTRPDGAPVGAVYGYTNMLLKMREQYEDDYLTVIFDAARKSFRMELYPEYKAHRPPVPDDLVPQFAIVREATRALGIPAIELEQYEADDLIASYAEAAAAKGLEVIIVSSDKDLMQLIRPGVCMLDPVKQKFINAAEVIEKFGVGPEKVVEVQALIGDATDNVPGVPSIGPKTAAELINQFGTLENVLANVESIKQPKRREVLTQHAENARLSRKLVELKRDLPLPTTLEQLEVTPLDRGKLLDFVTAQGFKAIVKRLGGESLNAPFAPTPQTPAAKTAATPVAVAAVSYETVRDEAALQRILDEALAAGLLGFDTETTSLNAVGAELVGVALSTAPGRAYYIPVGHVEGKVAAAQGNMFDASPERKLVAGQLPRDRVFEMLRPVLTNPAILKVGHNIKYDMVVLDKYDVTVTPIADTMLMSYCFGAGLNSHGLDSLAQEVCGHSMISFASVIGAGKDKKASFAEVEIEQATAYAAEDADLTLRLYHCARAKLFEARTTRVYETIERPLVPVIVAMEKAGILVSIETLNGLSREFEGKLAALEKEVHALAGMEFSIGSPKQLGEVLFDKLQLSGGKKSSKSGAYGTDAGILEDLAAEGSEIARKVLEWRQFSKLKSTYTDALPKAISPRDGRVHTSYSMVGASTGRLSSSDPNLQNIPIRSEEGRRIRTAFIAPQGFELISADYSQIELRLLAHVANIPSLKQAFREGADIHAITASQMFGVPLDQVNSDLRRSAKTINFGIIYGMSAHGLAVRLGIGRKEAGDYIERYFKQYPGIQEYMDVTIEFAKKHGYVETLYGRKVHLKGINDKNPNMRNFSERAAINAPLQGTAADIIKRAMVSVHAALAGTKSRLLLQVHDELVVEAPKAEAADLALQVKKIMEQSASLSVPITVEVGVGPHWGAIH